jgi:hypothetical protein
VQQATKSHKNLMIEIAIGASFAGAGAVFCVKFIWPRTNLDFDLKIMLAQIIYGLLIYLIITLFIRYAYPAIKKWFNHSSSKS